MRSSEWWWSSFELVAAGATCMMQIALCGCHFWPLSWQVQVRLSDARPARASRTAERGAEACGTGQNRVEHGEAAAVCHGCTSALE